MRYVPRKEGEAPPTTSCGKLVQAEYLVCWACNITAREIKQQSSTGRDTLRQNAQPGMEKYTYSAGILEQFMGARN